LKLALALLLIDNQHWRILMGAHITAIGNFFDYIAILNKSWVQQGCGFLLLFCFKNKFDYMASSIPID